MREFGKPSGFPNSRASPYQNASWHFVIWGGMNGAYQVVGEWMRPYKEKAVKMLKIDTAAPSHKLLKMLVTFGLVDIS